MPLLYSCVDGNIYSNKVHIENQYTTGWLHSKCMLSSLKNINSVGAELFPADGQTDRHDEANSRLSQFCETA